jgi:hypothetical protein
MAEMDGICSDGPPAAGLTTMPFDILRLIVWSEELSQDDVSALRLTCRALTNAAATRLFYRIAISKLNTDRDAFLSICYSPHLAEHVHEVVWLELSWDVELFDRIPTELTYLTIDDNTKDLCRYFHSEAKAAFWLPSVPACPRADDFDASTIDLERRQAVTGFKECFMAAIDLLPNLHTFISRPMDSTRAINPEAAYPMTAGLFQCPQDLPPLLQAPQTNDGLFLFLFPAMERPTSTVTRLRWADEFPGFSYLRPIPASAFEGLEILSLCLTPHRSPDGDKIAASDLEAACSRAAPTLRHLRLCLEHGALDASPGVLERVFLGDALATSQQCSLESLKLVAVRLGLTGLVNLIKYNARSLRHVHLESMSVKAKIIQQLADVPELKLKTFRVAEEDGATIVCERALRRYINGETNERCPNPEDCEFDHHYENCDEGVRRQMEGTNNHVFATTSITFDEGEQEPDWTVHIESSIGSDDSQSSQDSEDSQDSTEQRLRKGPKWVWGRYFNREGGYEGIYCHQVPDRHPKGHRTTVWKFTSRHGEVAYGDDPLEWFNEWDTNAGDVEEPTPYCEELTQFHRDGRDVEYEMGSLREYVGEWSDVWLLIKSTKPPEGAFRYDHREDPRLARRY